MLLKEENKIVKGEGHSKNVYFLSTLIKTLHAPAIKQQWHITHDIDSAEQISTAKELCDYTCTIIYVMDMYR